MKRFFNRLIYGLGLLAAAVILGAGGGIVYRMVAREPVPDRVILEADLTRPYVEYAPQRGPAAWLPGKAPVLGSAVDGLLRAARDDRVRMLVARVGGARLDMAKIQELRQAVIAFRGAEKEAWAWAESFGGGGPGNRAYYLATAFDRVHVQPSGEVALTGLSTRTPFLHGLLTRLDVRPNLAKREQYKTAANVLTRTGYTEPHEEAERAVLASFMADLQEGISRGRDLSPDEAAARVAEGPYLAEEAVEAGLVDGTAYRDQVMESARKRVGEGAQVLSLEAYRQRAGSVYDGDERIGVIYGVGRIVRGKSRRTPLGGVLMGSDSVASAFRAAVEDDAVRAVVFRIDSPGGSYVASDTIRREVVRAREAGKPVVVSMSGAAASGGYYVAAPADRIIAQPGTVTGSIGVLGGKMVTSGLWKKLGVRWAGLSTHENADLWSRTSSYSEAQWKGLQKRLDAIYEDFLARVSEGRGMDREDVREAAKGRVWTGRDALERGLVDELGGFPEAVRAAKRAAGIPDEETVSLKTFPRERSLWQWLLGGGPKSVEDLLGLDSGGRAELETVLRALRQAGLGPRAGVLEAGPIPCVD